MTLKLLQHTNAHFKTTIFTGSCRFLWFTFILWSLGLSLWWRLGLSLHFILIGRLQQNLWQRLLTCGLACQSQRCFILKVCICLRLHVLHLALSLCGWIGARDTFIAQIPHVQKSLHQRLDEFCWACQWALMETGHREGNVVWLRVVARSISAWKHWSVATEHLNSCRNLWGGMNP